MAKAVKIRNRNTKVVYDVTEREWETISNNPLISDQYILMTKPVVEIQSDATDVKPLDPPKDRIVKDK